MSEGANRAFKTIMRCFDRIFFGALNYFQIFLNLFQEIIKKYSFYKANTGSTVPSCIWSTFLFGSTTSLNASCTSDSFAHCVSNQNFSYTT